MPEIPEGAIVITPQQVYEKVMGLTEIVTQLVTRQENDNTANEVAELKGRVRSLEQRVWAAAGAAAAAGGGFGTLVTLKIGG